MNSRRIWLYIAILTGLAGYLAVFYATRLPSVERITGQVFRRIDFFAWLLLPDELLALWCGQPPQFAVLDRLPVLGLAGAILVGAAALGWLLLRLFRAQQGLEPLEVLVFSAAVGLNCVSTYMLALGLAGLLRERWLLIAPGVGILGMAAWALGVKGWGLGAQGWGLGAGGRGRVTPASGLRPPASRCQTPAPRPQSLAPRPESPAPSPASSTLSPRWLWLAAPFALAIVLGGMLPPVEFDVREYHLQVPKEFFQEGHVGFLPHNVYGNMPMGAEMLSLLAMSLSGDWWLGALAGKTVIAALAPLTALGLFAAGRRLFSTSAGVVAAIVYLSIPWVAQVSGLGLVDGAVGCYLFLAVYAVILSAQKHTPGSSPILFSFLGGYLAGGAVACKYPAMLFVVVPLAAWVFAAVIGRGRAILPAVFLVAAVAGCGLWLAKNWALTGNPTYPLLYEVFGDKTGTWTPQKNARWNRVHRPHDFSARALGKDLVRVALSSEWLSPLVMPLATLALLLGTRRGLLFALAGYFGFVILAWWLLTHRIDRFWIPVLPVVALLAGAGACWTQDRLWRRVLVGLLLLGCVSSLLEVTTVAGGYTSYFVSLRRLRDDPARLSAWHRYLNTHARHGRVLVVGDAQVFDLEMPILYSTCFDDSLFERWVKGRSAEQVRATFAQEGITHVYVDWGEIARYRSPGNYGFTDFVQPAVLDWLVAEAVVSALPQIEGSAASAYEVNRKAAAATQSGENR